MKKKSIAAIGLLSILALASCNGTDQPVESGGSGSSSTGSSSTLPVDKSLDGLLNAIQNYRESGIYEVTYDIKMGDGTDPNLVKQAKDTYTDKYVWIDGERAGYALLSSGSFTWSGGQENAVFQFLKSGDSYEVASPLLQRDTASNSYSPAHDLSSFSGFSFLYDADDNFLIDGSFFQDGSEADTFYTTNPSILSAFKKFAQASAASEIDSAALSVTDRDGIAFDLKAGDVSYTKGEIYNIGKGWDAGIDRWISSVGLPSHPISTSSISNILDASDPAQSSLLAKTSVTLQYLDGEGADEPMGSAQLSYSPFLRVMNASYQMIPPYQLVFAENNGNTQQMRRSAKDGGVLYEDLPSTSWDKGFIGAINPFNLLNQNLPNIVGLSEGDGDYYLLSPDSDTFVRSLSLTDASLTPTFSQVKFSVKGGKVVSMDAYGRAGYNQDSKFVRYLVHTDFSPDPATTPVDGWSYFQDKSDPRIQTYSESQLSDKEKDDNAQIAKSFSYLRGATAKSFSAIGFLTAGPIDNPDSFDENLPFKSADVDVKKAPDQYNAYRYDASTKTSVNSRLASRFINGHYRDYNYQMTRGFQEIDGKVFPIRIDGPSGDVAGSTQKVGSAHIYADAAKKADGSDVTSIGDKIALDLETVLDASPLAFRIDQDGNYALRDPINTTDLAQHFFLYSPIDQPNGGNVTIALYKNDPEHKIHYITYETVSATGDSSFTYIYFNYDANNRWFPYQVTPSAAKAFVAPKTWKEENAYLYGLMEGFLGADVASKIPFDYGYLKTFSGSLERDPYDIQEGVGQQPNDGTKRLSVVAFDGDALPATGDAWTKYLDGIVATFQKDLSSFQNVSVGNESHKRSFSDGKVKITFGDMTSEGTALLTIERLSGAGA